MDTITLDQALEAAMQLPPEQQEMLIDILQRRHIEQRRQEISDDAKETLAAFRAGSYHSQPATAIVAELRQEYQSDDSE